jgi:L-seryl-tRNA(Ser) seleniumtransferase
VTRDFPNEAGQPVPRVRIDVNPDLTGLSAFALQQRLMEHTPPVAVAAEYDRYLYLTPDTLDPGEEAIVENAIRWCFSGLGPA